VVVVLVRRVEPTDRGGWEPLFVGYNRFYGRELDAVRIGRAWSAIVDDRRIEALVAEADSGLVGLAHFFRHPSSTSADVCYLQDLFTDEAARGRGVASSLIAGVADWARAEGCARVYWHTRASNATARRLYDRVAENRGFIKYDLDL
jgi:GNAT superfamily N-acetyltransferase